MKEYLRNGAIVKTKNCTKCILLKDGYNGNDPIGDMFITLKDGNTIRLDNYDEDLKYHCEVTDNNEQWDIVAICQMSYIGDNFRRHIINESEIWTWSRNSRYEWQCE